MVSRTAGAAADSELDVIVIGAGAAGVAAARALQEAGVRTLVVEARNRVGGRARTVTDVRHGVLDLGCEWLHSADINPIVPVAKALGLHIDREPANWMSHVGGGFPAQDFAAFRVASDRFWAALENAARDGGPDRPASDLLEPGNPWNPLIDAISTYYNGAELDGVSIVDLDRYVDTGVNWRIAEGYGAFFEQAAASLDVRTGSRVHTIDHSRRLVRVETDKGSLSSRMVLVTAPTNVLARGDIRFVPELLDKRAAAAALPLGLADKVFFSIADGSDLPSGHLLGTRDRVETISFDLRPRGRPVVQGFLGGDFARRLEREGDRAFEAAARGQLTAMLGADIQADLTFLRATAWDRDPFSQGAYSHATPGCAAMRAVLAETVDDRLFFAGEACSPDFYSTAHGAWQTGIAAAQAIGARLRRVQAQELNWG